MTSKEPLTTDEAVAVVREALKVAAGAYEMDAFYFVDDHEDETAEQWERGHAALAALDSLQARIKELEVAFNEELATNRQFSERESASQARIKELEGQLAGRVELCEHAAEVVRLSIENTELRAALERIRDFPHGIPYNDRPKWVAGNGNYTTALRNIARQALAAHTDTQETTDG